MNALNHNGGCWSRWLLDSWRDAQERRRVEKADRCSRGIHEVLDLPAPGKTVVCINCKAALTT